MSLQSKEKERFSMLLLEPNEIYFEDFLVELWPVEPSQNMIAESSSPVLGRLKLCSKSFVFDPKNLMKPLTKIPYAYCCEITVWPANADDETPSIDESYLIIKCNQYTEMLENNILAPYKFVTSRTTFYFRFHYVDIRNYILQICQLQRASSLHSSEQNDMIATIVFSRHNRAKFNPFWLQDLSEKILIECKVDEINPLVSNPGRLLLTNISLYFQPYNNIQPDPVIKIKFDSITSLTKRRYLLRHTGLEIKWKSDGNEQTFYISFQNVTERSEFYGKLVSQEAIKTLEIPTECMTLKWQNSLISNYEYLLYLNSLADRTFQDLTQYPVFPWILKDYTSEDIDLSDEKVYRDLSKPIGALNSERLERLKERCDEMGYPKFLYGSHYSAPGLVLFFLVRKFPHLMLCLQNGRFDHPDRMFNKINDTFNNCLTNMSDFKELIPEFYDTEQNGDFLLNLHKVNFGSRCDGEPVNHVILPPWAKGSHHNFIRILRDALESEHVSNNLHHWIDLIFGYKQRGEAALKADNLFYYLCYEGSVDLDDVKDQTNRHALEVQISEFGQIPKQLFDKPHVSRNKSNACCSNDLQLERAKDRVNRKFSLDLKFCYTAHKDVISTIIADKDMIITTGKDSLLKCFRITEQRAIRNVNLESLPISACVKIPQTNILALGSWDNTIFLYNCDYGKITDVIPAHDDSVSCLNLIEGYGILISGSWDCSVKLWKGFSNIEYKSFRFSDSLIVYLPFEEKVVCLSACVIHKTELKIFIGISSGEIFTCDFSIEANDKVESKDAPRILLKHKSELNSIKINPMGTKLASCSDDGQLYITDVVTGMKLFSKLLESPAFCLDWCDIGDLLFMGDISGNISIWDLKEGSLKLCENILKGSICCIKYCPKNNFVIAAAENNGDYQIKVWSFS